MGTFSAQFLIGSPHPYSGGIIPDYRIYLSENSRPALVLKKESEGSSLKTWVPTLERTLEDALLMISAYVLQDEEILKGFEGLLEKKDFIELYEDLKVEKINELYNINKKVIKKYGNLKVIISIFEDSLIRSQIPVLKDYQVELEVCVPVYSAFFSPMEKEMKFRGSLEGKNK